MQGAAAAASLGDNALTNRASKRMVCVVLTESCPELEFCPFARALSLVAGARAPWDNLSIPASG